MMCRQTGNHDLAALDILASAYAEAGRFDEAVAAASQALLLPVPPGQTALAEEIRRRLELYRKRTSWRP